MTREAQPGSDGIEAGPADRPYHVCIGARGSVFGGIERFTCELARWLDRRGCRTTIVAGAPSVFADRLADCASVRVVKTYGEHDRRFRPGHLWRAHRFFRRLAPDAALFNHTRISSFSASLVAARLAGVHRIVCSYHRTLAVDESFRRLRLFPPRSWWAARGRLRYRTAVHCVDAVLCNNRISRDVAVREYGAPAGKVHVEHMGVDVDRLAPDPAAGRAGRRAMGIPEDAFAVGTLCRLDGKKGEALLIEAVAALAARQPQVKPYCVLIGDGPARGRLVERARAAGLGDRAVFPGFVADREKYLNALDAFALLSETESFGLALIEAMATERACVATYVGGMREIVTDGVDGLFARAAEPDAVARLLGRLAGDADLRRRLGEQARQTVLRRFRQDEYLARVARYLGVPDPDRPTERQDA